MSGIPGSPLGPARHGQANAMPAAPHSSARIEVGFGSPSRQNRWTIGFRWLLSLPHVLYLLVLSIAALVMVVAGWLAALAMGRLPGPIHRELTSYLRYEARLISYMLLITDRYPPFRLTRADYPIDIEVPNVPLPRLTVLFRLILVIPAAIVSNLLNGGLGLIIVFVWLIALVRGRLPRALFEAVASVIRFQVRLTGYMLLLVRAYPDGIFGDAVSLATGPPPYPESAPTGPPVGPPRVGRLLLTGSAKGVVILFICLGVLYNVGSDVLRLEVLRSPVEHPVASDFATAYGVLVDQVNQDQPSLQDCPSSGPSSCSTLATEVASAYAGFANELSYYPVPSRLAADAAMVRYSAINLNGFFVAIAQGRDSYTSLSTQIDTDQSNLSSEASALWQGLNGNPS